MRRYDNILSIVTPTYNRCELLESCYMSLVAQTYKKFEWIIIDDGSEDETEVIVNSFINDTEDFKIKYIKKKNGGKHTALNESHSYIEGEYVLILDSDDTLVEDAVKKILDLWKEYDAQNEVGIITFLKGNKVDEPVCYAKEEGIPVDIFRGKRICMYGSDCCEVIRTELFKKYPFPVFENEKFMAETVLWYRVGITHKCVYINEVIYLCEYREDGLTNAGRAMRIKNPYGGMLNSDISMNKKNYMKQRIKNGLLFVCYGFFANLSPKEIVRRYKDNQLIKTLCLVPGFILYKTWKKRYS